MNSTFNLKAPKARTAGRKARAIQIKYAFIKK